MSRLSGLLVAVFLMLISAPLAACGGGSGQGGSSEGTVAGNTGDPIEGTPPANPPPTNPPPGTPPPNPPPVNPPPVNPPPVNPPPPGGPVLPTPLPVFASFDGFENVACVTADPQTDTLYAIRKGTGELLVVLPGRENAQVVATIAALGAATGMAFHPSQPQLFVALDGGTGNDDTLHTVAVSNQAEAQVGTITGAKGIESLAFREGVLYAVDSERNVLLTLDTTTGAPTDVGDLGGDTQNVRGLVYDTTRQELLGTDASNQACVIIDTATGAGRPGVTLRDGSLRALAYAPISNKLYGVSEATDQLIEIDPRGTWINGADIRSLTYDTAAGALLGVHKGFGLLTEIHPDSGWKQPVGVIPDNGIEGLAYEPAGPWLFAISTGSKVLYRVTPNDAASTVVGTVAGMTDPASLAWAPDGLYSADRSTSTLFRIDAANAVAVSVSPLTGQTGVQSLAFDPDRAALLAYADASATFFSVDTTAGAPPVVIDTLAFAQVGGMAWIDGRVVGMDLANESLVTLEAPAPTGLGFDTVHALAVNEASLEVIACDVDQSLVLDVDLDNGTAAQRHPIGTARIEAMAFDALLGSFLLADSANGTLLRLNSNGSPGLVGAPGALGTGIRALAHVPAATPLLLGFDAASTQFVSIDLGTGVPSPLGAAQPTLDVQAMTFDVDTGRVLALDRATSQLMEVDPLTGGTTPFGQPVAATDVRGMGIIPGTAELILVDATTDEILIVDRFTGGTIVQQSKLTLHRGADDAPSATLLWPRGDVRLASLHTLALTVSDTYEGEGVLEFRSARSNYKQQIAEPARTTTVQPFPKALRDLCRPGDAFEWILYDKNRKAVARSSFRVVGSGDVSARLARIEASPYFQKHAAWVRELVAVRILQRQGLHTEALARGLHASAGAAQAGLWARTLNTSLRALATEDEKTIAWDIEPFVRWLATKDKSAQATRTLLMPIKASK